MIGRIILLTIVINVNVIRGLCCWSSAEMLVAGTSLYTNTTEPIFARGARSRIAFYFRVAKFKHTLNLTAQGSMKMHDDDILVRSIYLCMSCHQRVIDHTRCVTSDPPFATILSWCGGWLGNIHANVNLVNPALSVSTKTHATVTAVFQMGQYLRPLRSAQGSSCHEFRGRVVGAMIASYLRRS
ncbi:hypothetical protein BDR04DRAFT_847136 [Suillus decipiens]|nr:hypothetical protein BDR04DRAFT_847136 [Suillus decipiens]